jgi:hypothetical protein
MSRYFELTIGTKTWSSHDNNGLQKKGFLKFELNVVLMGKGENSNKGVIKLWGLGLKEIFTGSDYFNQQMSVKVGMNNGLPFANPKSKGVAFTGMVFGRAFPVHTGLDQYLELMVMPGVWDKFPDRITIDWSKGEKLSDALKRILKDSPVTIKIRDDIAIFDSIHPTGANPCTFTDIESFSQFLNIISIQSVKENGYLGVKVFPQINGLLITDGSQPQTAKKLEIYDFIGQPTFQQFGVYDAELICRGDLQAGDTVTFPDRMQLKLNQNAVQAERDSDVLSLKGDFIINQIAYNLNSRGNSARDWGMVITVNKAGYVQS